MGDVVFAAARSRTLLWGAGSVFGTAASFCPGEGGHGAGPMPDGGPLVPAGLVLLVMAAAPWAGARPQPGFPGGQPRPSVVLVACDSLVRILGGVVAGGAVREGGKAAALPQRRCFAMLARAGPSRISNSRESFSVTVPSTAIGYRAGFYSPPPLRGRGLAWDNEGRLPVSL